MAGREAVWEIVADPHHLPRWWPGVTRVERVQDEPDGEDVCTVTLEEHQQLRGSFRAGLLLQRRPASRRVEAALRALAALF